MDGIAPRRHRRRNYQLLQNEGDSPRASLISRRPQEGVPVVACDKCSKRHTRRRAIKRCLECKQNLCDSCAQHDAVRDKGWVPTCILLCWRFFFPSKSPHKIVALPDGAELRASVESSGENTSRRASSNNSARHTPDWTRFTDTSHVFVIPRVTRDSLRKNKRLREERAKRKLESSSDIPEVEVRRRTDNSYGQAQDTIGLRNRYPGWDDSDDDEFDVDQINQSKNEITSYIVEEPEDKCPVCLDDIPVKEARLLPCSHAIHSQCLRQLLANMEQDFGVKCPVCNQLSNVRNYYAPPEQWVNEFPVVTNT